MAGSHSPRGGLMGYPREVFDAAVAVGVAAFLAGDDPSSDEAVRSRLEAGGVEPWLAERLLVFLPLAFGRRLLPGAGLSDSFHDGPALRSLHDEPVYLAAVARAESADRTELERIGLRSSEVRAVNDPRHHGVRLEDLVFAPMALPEPLPPAGTGDGGVPSPRAAFGAFLAGHGVPVAGHRAGPRVGELELDARVFPHPHSGTPHVMVQVDFAVRHPELAAPWLVESFAGAGSTWREALHQSISMFERGSLHPIVAALHDRTACQDQVTWEPYHHPAGTYDLCLGAQLNLYSPAVPPAGPLLDQLLRALREVSLRRAIHWLRLSTFHRDGTLQTNEVLLDGEPWAAGAAVVAAAPAPTATGMVGVRVFGVLVPTWPADAGRRRTAPRRATGQCQTSGTSRSSVA